MARADAALALLTLATTVGTQQINNENVKFKSEGKPRRKLTHPTERLCSARTYVINSSLKSIDRSKFPKPL